MLIFHSWLKDLINPPLFKNFKTLPSSTFSLLKKLLFFKDFARQCPPPSNPVIILSALSSIPQSTSNLLIFKLKEKFSTIPNSTYNPNSISTIPNKEEHPSGNFFLFPFHITFFPFSFLIKLITKFSLYSSFFPLAAYLWPNPISPSWMPDLPFLTWSFYYMDDQTLHHQSHSHFLFPNRFTSHRQSKSP